MITPPRTDLPEPDQTIALLHGCGQWYGGQHRVVKVDPEKREVEVRPLFWWHQGTIVVRQSDGTLQWNLVQDLTEAEQATLLSQPPERPQ